MGTTGGGPISAGADQRGTDLGRRVREYRRQAGLSVEEAAAGAGMAVSYLEYLEASRTPNPTPSGLARLAAALGTTAPALAGAWLDLPPGRPAPVDRAAMEPLNAGQCRGYLGTSGVGRLVIVEARDPVAIPVNYATLGSGEARVVADPGELAAVSGLGIAPWAGGDRDTYVRIIATEVTGQRIRATT